MCGHIFAVFVCVRMWYVGAANVELENNLSPVCMRSCSRRWWSRRTRALLSKDTTSPLTFRSLGAHNEEDTHTQVFRWLSTAGHNNFKSCTFWLIFFKSKWRIRHWISLIETLVKVVRLPSWGNNYKLQVTQVLNNRLGEQWIRKKSLSVSTCRKYLHQPLWLSKNVKAVAVSHSISSAWSRCVPSCSWWFGDSSSIVSAWTPFSHFRNVPYSLMEGRCESRRVKAQLQHQEREKEREWERERERERERQRVRKGERER